MLLSNPWSSAMAIQKHTATEPGDSTEAIARYLLYGYVQLPLQSHWKPN